MWRGHHRCDPIFGHFLIINDTQTPPLTIKKSQNKCLVFLVQIVEKCSETNEKKIPLFLIWSIMYREKNMWKNAKNTEKWRKKLPSNPFFWDVTPVFGIPFQQFLRYKLLKGITVWSGHHGNQLINIFLSYIEILEMHILSSQKEFLKSAIDRICS